MDYPTLYIIGERISINQKIVNKRFPLTKDKDRDRVFLHPQSWADIIKKMGPGPIIVHY
jgi:hypothetical protein